jgi:hypothetical protein
MSKDVGEPMPDAAFRRTELKGSTIEASYAGALSFFRSKYSRDLDGVDVVLILERPLKVIREWLCKVT